MLHNIKNYLNLKKKKKSWNLIDFSSFRLVNSYLKRVSNITFDLSLYENNERR